MIKRLIDSLRASYYCLEEVFRPGQSRSYRIWRLKEAFGIDPEPKDKP